MSEDIVSAARFVSGLTDEERAERARLAVKNFRAMQRSLTGFARALTGNKKVRVELDTGIPRTDGERIFFRPPLALGAPGRHERMLCEKRGNDSRLLCEACRVREEVMAPIYHEISHIAFDSFAPTLEHHKLALTQRAIDEWGTKYSERIKETIAQMPNRMKNDYKTMAGLISPFLPILFNALEDARVNASMFRARPGVKVMMKSHVFGLLEDGIEQPDGTIVTWNQQPLNAQVMAGCFVIGAGYEINSDWFDELVNDALADETLAALCKKAGASRRAADVYEISFQVLARLRELGFCKNPNEEEEEEDDDAGQDDSAGDSPSDSDDRSDVDDDSSGDSSNPEDEASEPDPSSEGTEVPAEEEGDEAPAEEPEEGTGSEGDGTPADSDESIPEDDGAGGEAGSEVGDESVPPTNEQPTEEGDEAELDGEAEDMAEGGDGGTSPSRGDAGTERPESGDEELDDGGDSRGDEPSDVGPEGRNDGSDEADPTEGGEAEEDDGHGAGGDLPDGDGQSDRPSGSDDIGEEAGDVDSSDGPESPDPSAEEVPATPLNRDGVDDDAEPGDQTDEGGVSDSNPLPAHPESSGDGGEGAEDAERDADSATADEGGDGDRSEDASIGDTDTAEATSVDWSAEEEGRIDPSEDVSGEPVGQQPAPESEAATDPGEEEPVDPSAFDMRGDEGEGGIKVEEDDDLDYGDPEDIEGVMRLLENHTEPPKSVQRDLDKANEAIDQAIIQGVYFETPSSEVWGVRIHREGDPGLNQSNEPCDNAWNHSRVHEADITDVEAGIECDLDVPESIMGKALLHTRRTFDANKASVYQKNLKSGRVNGRVLGRRAWSGDERLFGKKRVPGKRDYFVLIGVDVSGSTVGVNLALAKRAAMAQTELCQRAGVKFAVYAHTFNNLDGQPYESSNGYCLDMYEIKTADEPWDAQRKNRLATIGPDGGNLDGHTLEFYRKRLDEVEATDKIILYYTDGRMPASNYDEELEILQREIRTCKAKGYTLLGVGIRTDSPIKHGLDTVRVDNDENLKDVIAHLEKRLAPSR